MNPFKQIDEPTLLQRIAAGDEKAMQQLYDHYIRYLTAVCSRYVSNDEDVHDVLQDVFIKVFTAIDTFSYRGEGSLKAWLTRVVLNEAIAFVRRSGRMSYVELNDETLNVADETPDTEGIPASVLHAMIRDLPDGYRTIFNLYVVEEKSHKEIAQLLGIKESTSASQYHRAKALLAQKIKYYKTLYTVS